MPADPKVPVTRGDRFAARIDNTALREVLTHELRTRLDLLDAEIEQLDHDEAHVQGECFGTEKFFHLRSITRDRLVVEAKRRRYAEELSKRAT